MANFDPNAILRGAQLTLVGAHRALQNPGLFTSDHYRQAALAVGAGLVIRLIVGIPIAAVRVSLWTLSFVMDFEHSSWDNDVIEGLSFVEHRVLQASFFFFALMRYITPTLDNMFMDSLNWVDKTYVRKHKTDDPRNLRDMYYPNLSRYPTHGDTSQRKRPKDALLKFVMRYGRRAGISLAVYFLSFTPVVGRFVLPAASFYTFRQAVGPKPAIAIFATALVLPRRYLATFLQSYFSSRSLMRELLEPYFSRIRFTPEQKRKWFRDREGVLFGFGIGFFVFLKIPLLGVLIYGIAEASTAYLITKITDPPPPLEESEGFAESQARWKNKHEFLSVPLAALDTRAIQSHDSNSENPLVTPMPSKKFT